MDDKLCNLAIDAYKAKTVEHDAMELIYDKDSFMKIKEALKDTHFDFKAYLDKYYILEDAYVRMRTENIIVGYKDLEAFDLMATFYKTPICFVVDKLGFCKCIDQISCEFSGSTDLDIAIEECLSLLTIEYAPIFKGKLSKLRKKHKESFNSEHIFQAFIGLKKTK